MWIICQYLCLWCVVVGTCLLYFHPVTELSPLIALVDPSLACSGESCRHLYRFEGLRNGAEDQITALYSRHTALRTETNKHSTLTASLLLLLLPLKYPCASSVTTDCNPSVSPLNGFVSAVILFGTTRERWQHFVWLERVIKHPDHD